MLENCILLDILHVCVKTYALWFHIEYLIISMRISNNNISYKDSFSVIYNSRDTNFDIFKETLSEFCTLRIHYIIILIRNQFSYESRSGKMFE